MPLIKHRPKIRLYTDKQVVIGRPTTLRLVLDARAEVTLESLSLFLERRVTSMQRVWRQQLLGRRLGENLTLPEGESEYLIKWIPAAGSPPSHRGRGFRIDYRLRVIAAVPWWPDRKSEFSFTVVLPPPESSGEPFVVRSESPSGASLEVGLASELVAPGELVEGVLAVTGARVRRIRMSVIGRESIGGYVPSAGGRSDFYRAGVALDAQELESDGRLPFRFRLPKKMGAASFVSPYGVVDWRLVVRADVPWERDLVLVAPLTMASELPPTREGRRPALLVGSERIRTLWTEIARRTGMVFDGESLSKTVGAVRVEVREDTVLGDVPHLLASLSWERSLGPEVGVAKNVRGKRRRRRHGRFPQQSEHLFSQLVALIAELESYDVGERSASLSIPIRGVRRGPLLRFCRIALDVAGKLQELQRSMPLPEPLALSERVWRQLASRLDGTLWPGPAMVTGTLSGANVELGVDWEERDEATWIAVRPPWAVDQGPSLADLASELGLDAVRFEDDALRTSLPAWPTAADEPIAVARKLVDLAQRIRLGGPFR